MASAGKLGIVSSLEKAGKTTPEKVTNPDTAPDLTNGQNFPELGRKRKKSLTSPPTNQPHSKRKGTLPASEANGSKELKGQAKGEGLIYGENSEESIKDASKTDDIMGPPKKQRNQRPSRRGSTGGVSTRSQSQSQRSYSRQERGGPRSEEIDVEAEMENIVAGTNPPSYEGDPMTVPNVGRDWQQYAQNPTYAGNLNQYTCPKRYDLTRANEVRDSHYFWDKYKNKIAPDKPNNDGAYMDSFGKIQGIQDNELRDRLQDPAIRSGIYTEVLRDEIEDAITERIETTLEGMKERTKDDHRLLAEGKYAEYHEIMLKICVK